VKLTKRNLQSEAKAYYKRGNKIKGLYQEEKTLFLAKFIITDDLALELLNQ
jgi:hypothetical protein